jgi:hypothetical protein
MKIDYKTTAFEGVEFVKNSQNGEIFGLIGFGYDLIRSKRVKW